MYRLATCFWVSDCTHSTGFVGCATNSLKRLSELNIGFDYDDNTLIFTDSKLIIDALDKMHMVLHELCEKLGYKTKFIGK